MNLIAAQLAKRIPVFYVTRRYSDVHFIATWRDCWREGSDVKQTADLLTLWCGAVWLRLNDLEAAGEIM
jgi:hypothetical protein